MNWTVILPLLGVVVGWVLTQAATWFTARQADKRILKEVLYFLLELHHQLGTLEQVETSLPPIMALLKKRLPAPPAELQAEVDKLMERALRAIVTPVAGERLANLKEGYNAGLLRLAAVDPISAFRLRGQEEVIQRLPLLMAAVEQAGGRLGMAEPPPPEMLDFFQQHVEPDQIRETRVLVREVAEQLARRIGRATRKELAGVFSRATQANQELEQKLPEYAEKAFNGLVAQMNG